MCCFYHIPYNELSVLFQLLEYIFITLQSYTDCLCIPGDSSRASSGACPENYCTQVILYMILIGTGGFLGFIAAVPGLTIVLRYCHHLLLIYIKYLILKWLKYLKTINYFFICCLTCMTFHCGTIPSILQILLVQCQALNVVFNTDVLFIDHDQHAVLEA